MIGTSLGRYRVLGPLGEGGMGRVYLAEDPSLGRKLAVKVLPPEFTNDPERRERLLHEARAASALNHPNILTIHDLGESDGALYVAMELIEGCTLREWARGRHRAPGDGVRLLRQALAALGTAHDAGLVHRDLKPENIMVRTDGLLKILDFGLARSASPGAVARTATLPGTVLGTAPYMSPEQVLGQPAGPASDLFSIGTILYEILTGRHPFAADSAVEIMHRILHESPDPPSLVNHDLTADFDFVLAKALSKDPRRRHASAHDLDVDLETLECGCGPDASASAPNAGPRAMAVLPFKNIGGDPELGYLGVGLADAVITRLSSSPDLIVRTTSSIAPYQNQAVDPRRVGAELDVSAVLDASFQRIGERFRATARLVETGTGRSLWAGKVDLRFDDIFEMQDQVAQGIAEAMTARLTESAGAAGKRYTPSPEAYELVMRGQEAFRGADADSFRRAIELYERATKADPGYAEAWAHLGSVYHATVDGGFDPDPIWILKAEEALSRSLALDPENVQARFGTAALRLTRGAKREAYDRLSHVAARTPNLALVYHYLGYLFRLCDMFDEALAACGKAREMDPSSPWPFWHGIRLRAMGGDARGAWEDLETMRARFGPRARTRNSEAMILCYEGRFEELLARFTPESMQAAHTSGLHYDLALAHLRLGRPELASASLAVTERFSAVDMDSAAHAASLRGYLGDRDQAFRHLERAIALGNDTVRFYENPIFFEPLFSDPRWEPFLEGVRGRVAQWKREFRWPPASIAGGTRAG
ncbi:MAG TPA: protein kinase [Candidatus Limnocylindrales bacterium]|nr:protein kinase [Candidatus Limnocylindrales bacterium]